MRTVVSFLFLLIGASALWAQTSDGTNELEQLRSLVAAQQKALEQQQNQIKALESALAEQKQVLQGVVEHESQSATLVPAVAHLPQPNPTLNASCDMQTQPPKEPGQEPTPEQQEKVEEELQLGPEIADVTPDTPALKLGPANIRLIG